MARTIYGASVANSPTKEVNFDGGRVIGGNSVVFTQGDTVKISSGFLQIAGTTDAVYGIVNKTATMASTNQTVAQVKPSVTPIDQNMEFLMGTNADISGTNVGVYYRLTGATTNTIQVDVSNGATTGTSRVVICTKADPLQEGGTGSGSGARQGLFKFVKVMNFSSNQPDS